MKKKLIHILILLSLALSACSSAIPTATEENITVTATEETPASEEKDAEIARPATWNDESHSNDVEPNYAVVFPTDKVNTMTITIAPEDWEAMQADMVSLFGEQGTGDQRGGFAGGGMPPMGENGDFQPPEGFAPPADGERPEMPEGGFPEGGRPGGFGGGDMTPENPMWVEATIEFNGEIWTNVGVRYKGNSSLTSSWRSGTEKMPLKIDFDEFEDEYPEIDNQRFYGFKQLSLASGFNDTSFMRDAAAAQILADAGLPAAKTAFYEVILDYGEGAHSLGLYVVIEVIDDTAVERYFGNDDGNIYEGDGTAASFAAATYEQIEDGFLKENNTDSDWSDIEALFDILHSDLRTSDPVAWRTALEAIFDTDAFLEWLAISTAIENWDAYGSMSHNYYLYNNPDTGQLTWISWDHNEAFSTGDNGFGGFRGEREMPAELSAMPDGDNIRGGGMNRSVSLDKSDVGENWPLIRYLLDDPVYYEQYVGYLAETVEGAFNAEKMEARYQQMAELIAPYASADVGEEVFNNAVQALIDHAHERTEEIEAFLAESEF